MMKWLHVKAKFWFTKTGGQTLSDFWLDTINSTCMEVSFIEVIINHSKKPNSLSWYIPRKTWKWRHVNNIVEIEENRKYSLFKELNIALTYPNLASSKPVFLNPNYSATRFFPQPIILLYFLKSHRGSRPISNLPRPVTGSRPGGWEALV
jgi:hypothetical protein